MVLLTQHYDTVTAVGAHSKSIRHDGAVHAAGDVAGRGRQITAALLTSSEVERGIATAKPPAHPARAPSPTTHT